MNKEQKYTPKYWVVHDKESDDILVKTLSKNKNRAIDRFFNYYTYDLVGTMSDNELDDWWDNHPDFVCELIEIRLVGGA